MKIIDVDALRETLMSLSMLSNSDGPAVLDPVKDVDLSSFMAEVVEASRQQLVIVDFWATWCGPCKQLTPILEKLVCDAKGTVKLAKIDIDKNPEIAQQMGVQSVPAVFAFFQGRPVDGFMGALPESQVKSWIDRLQQATKATSGAAPEDNGFELALSQADEFLEAKNFAAAQSIYNEIHEAEPGNAAAYAGLIRVPLVQGDAAKAKQILDAAPAQITKNKILTPLRAQIDLASEALAHGSLADLQAKLSQNPKDHETQFNLAMALYAAGAREKAVDNLLEIVRLNRSWNEDAARKQLVKFFEAFGPTDPLTIASRKRLSSIMFS